MTPSPNKFAASTALALMFFIAGCDKDTIKLSNNDSEDIIDEAIVEAYYQDLDGLAGVVIQAPSDNEFNGGRSSGSIVIQDERFNCNGIVITLESNGTPESPQGVVTVDFGSTGCADSKGNIRKGKLLFTYSGRRFEQGSTVVTTTDNYFINGIKLEGTRTTTNLATSTQDTPRFNVVLVNGKATFPDGKIAFRESNLNITWIRGATPALDKLIILPTSTASGVTRNGREYQVTLTRQLEYLRYCRMAVSGIKNYLIDFEKEIVIDYGGGSCDKTLTVTIEGITRTLTIN